MTRAVDGVSFDDAIRLLEDESLHQKFRENAKANADLFDIHNIVPQCEKLYNRFLPKPEKVMAVDFK